MNKSDLSDVAGRPGPFDIMSRSASEPMSASTSRPVPQSVPVRLPADLRRKPLKTANECARPHIVIAEALRNNWFEIWYQPKIDLKRKCLAGAEALARIRHPQLGVLAPGSFEAEADEASIGDLAQQALLAALCDWTLFEDAGFNLHLAVNVPVGVLLRLPIFALVAEYRPRSELWPGLVVEVTEDQIVRDIALSKRIAAQLRGSGIALTIDDFGAGSSSFASLRNLPFAELKIDQFFVRNCTTDAANAAACQAAIDLAHSLGSAAVATGVASQADLQAVMAMGCDFAQGSLVAPPMQKEFFLDLLRQRMRRAGTAPRRQPASPAARVA